MHLDAAMQIASTAAAGDFDGDGFVDIATVCSSEAKDPYFVCILRQMPDLVWSLSTFELSSQLWTTGAGRLHSVDFDEDGHEDVLVSEMGAFAILRLMDDAPILWTQLSSDDPATLDFLQMYPAVPVDILGDGTPDILAGADFKGAEVWQRTDLQWQPVGAPVALPSCGDLAWAVPIDFDHMKGQDVIAIGSHLECDGHPAEPNDDWNRVAVLVALDGPAPALHRILTMPAGIAGRQTLQGDLDADGWADFGVFDGETVVLYHNLGPDGVEQQMPLLGVFSMSANPALLADVDGDGDTELVGVAKDGVAAVWDPLLSTSTSFLEAVTPDVPKPGVLLLAEDFNGDGLADLLFKRSTTSVSPLLVLSAP